MFAAHVCCRSTAVRAISISMNLDRLTARFELCASFKERQQLALEAVEQLERGEYVDITRLLGHEVEGVRLGAIEILRAARFRPALKFLAAVTLQKQGDERAFAARAVAELADGDEPRHRALLTPLVRTWRSFDDEFMDVNADALAVQLGMKDARTLQLEQLAQEKSPSPAGPVTAPSSPAIDRALSAQEPGVSERSNDDRAEALPIFGITSKDASVRRQAIANTLQRVPQPERQLVDALFDATTPGVRLDLVNALETLGGEPFIAVLERLLQRADGDLGALVLRALVRIIPTLTAARMAFVHDALAATRGRFLEHPLAVAAMDECTVACRPVSDLNSLVASADRIAPDAAYRLARRLMTCDEKERLRHFQGLFPALVRSPRRALLFAGLLESAWPHLRPTRRDQVRALLRQAAAKRMPAGLSASAVATIGRLYALAHTPGVPVPLHVLTALGEHTDVETALAAIAIHEAGATDGDARMLAEYLTDTHEPVREAARSALSRLGR